VIGCCVTLLLEMGGSPVVWMGFRGVTYWSGCCPHELCEGGEVGRSSGMSCRG